MTTALGNSSISYSWKELNAHSYCFCASLRSSGEEDTQVWRHQSQHMLTPNCMSHKVIQETDARVGKWVKHAGSSAFHSLSHPSLPVFRLVNTTNFLGKPHRGREERPGVNRQGGIRTKVSLWHKAGKLQVGKGANTHTHILSHGAPVREEHSWGKWACAEHLAMTRAFFFYRRGQWGDTGSLPGRDE